MNGYSKMRVGTDFTAKSTSIDFSDLTFSPPPPKGAAPQEPLSPRLKAQQRDQAGAKPRDHSSWQDGGGQKFGVALSRTCSSASQRFRATERATTTGSGGSLQAVVRRAFSMRKASSVADGYWRIHDTADHGDEDMMEEEEEEEQKQEQMRPSRKKKGRILRACKKLFGF